MKRGFQKHRYITAEIITVAVSEARYNGAGHVILEPFNKISFAHLILT